MNLACSIELYAYRSLGLQETKIVGFKPQDEEQIRAVLKKIPSFLLTNFNAIIADPQLGAKHGRYDEDDHEIHLNPHDFESKLKFGRGAEKKLPHVDLTLAHEIGHSVFYEFSPAEKEEWKKLSGWKIGSGTDQEKPYSEKRPGWPQGTSVETHRKGVQFTRHYAERNWHEDFADAFGFYVMGQRQRVPIAKRQFIARMLGELQKEKPVNFQ